MLRPTLRNPQRSPSLRQAPSGYTTIMSVTYRLRKVLRARGWSRRNTCLAVHYTAIFLEQILAIVPISAHLLLVMFIFFQRGPSAPLELVLGLVSAIIGLTLFADALRFAVMPLAEVIGTNLPKKFSRSGVFFVAFVLGGLCTYAEPAIASLRPLAAIVERDKAPFLYLMLNQMQEVLVLAVAAGVGCAAVLGTLRFLEGYSLKPLILLSITPTLACACYIQWGDPRLAPMLGLAWDCGAVTTGPVTVPILLAIGIGVIRSKKLRRRAQLALRNTVETSSGQQSTLEGFGIVTIASLLPILGVEILGIVLSFIYSLEDILDVKTEAPQDEESVWEQSPLVELTVAARAVLPLATVLLCLVVFVLREPLPPLTIYLSEEEMNAQEREGEEEECGEESPTLSSTSSGAKHVLWSSMMWKDVFFLESDPDIVASSPASATASPQGQATSWLMLFLGILMALIGMALFNVGLTYGFTSIGDQVGQVLPSAFMEVPKVSDSPVFGMGAGITITIATVFILGVLATRAEPALNVLGKTVEKMSRGSFSRNLLIYSVCLGVGTGMSMGAVKILFGVPIIFVILIKYFITAILTFKAPESFTNVAWDSAGVTTGPVTVPFVLAIGVGFCKASDCTEGFGILTNASVGPIIMVLLVQTIRMSRGRLRAAKPVARRPTSESKETELADSGAEGVAEDTSSHSRPTAAEEKNGAVI